jgi:hypothetical protein
VDRRHRADLGRRRGRRHRQDLRTSEALDAIAAGFARWYGDGPADVGLLTSNVLRAAGPSPTAGGMSRAAAAAFERSGSAGNGSLMRTAPVALVHLDDPVALVEAAMTVSALTHSTPRAQAGAEAGAEEGRRRDRATGVSGFRLRAIVGGGVRRPRAECVPRKWRPPSSRSSAARGRRTIRRESFEGSNPSPATDRRKGL